MEFTVGCNYWASNAGVAMWKQFDKAVIARDLETLSSYGVRYLRVFPLWSDFQPVKPHYTCGGEVFEYVTEADVGSENPYFLDETMVARFSEFLELCERYELRVIVGLVTGWMSGGLFVPTALYGKDVLTDPLALYFEQLFIQGFVGRFADRSAIMAWDLGNECNCAGKAETRFQAAAWTAAIANAIRAADPTREVISGMHGLTLDGVWRIQDQAQFTDRLTTHPYPLWCRHTSVDEMLSLRTTMHATAESKWYADIGGKPCLAEEIGTMGPMICSDETAAQFLRLNLFSLWANGASGLLWWCSHDQNRLTVYPYTTNMIERELGLLTAEGQPKPAVYELEKFTEAVKDISLPAAQEHGVCLLTRDQDHWGAAYMTYILGKTIGLNWRFSYAAEQELPLSPRYLLPSLNGTTVMPRSTYEQLKQRVRDGADLYISLGNAALEGFEELSGVTIVDSCDSGKQLKAAAATVLSEGENGLPMLTVNRYGRGRVFVAWAPVETDLLTRRHAFEGPHADLYNTVFADAVSALPVQLKADGAVCTYHPFEDGMYAVVVNHTGKEQPLCWELNGQYAVDTAVYGSFETAKPYDACVLKFRKIKI